MRERRYPKIMYLMLSCVFMLLTGMYAESTFAQAAPNIGVAPVMTGIIEGKILEVETNTLLVQTENGNTVRVRMPGKSGKSASEFSKGEFIEADVSPEGITTSVRTGPNIEHK